MDKKEYKKRICKLVDDLKMKDDDEIEGYFFVTGEKTKNAKVSFVGNVNTLANVLESIRQDLGTVTFSMVVAAVLASAEKDSKDK